MNTNLFLQTATDGWNLYRAGRNEPVCTFPTLTGALEILKKSGETFTVVYHGIEI